MKEAFLQSMRLIYPQGVDNAYQHRDVVRIYSMGWCDALMAADQKQAVAAWVEEFRPLADLNWWPDASWRWW